MGGIRTAPASEQLKCEEKVYCLSGMDDFAKDDHIYIWHGARLHLQHHGDQRGRIIAPHTHGIDFSPWQQKQTQKSLDAEVYFTLPHPHPRSGAGVRDIHIHTYIHTCIHVYMEREREREREREI
jgi:hypothetical protein